MNKNSLKVISAILAISLAMSACGIASTATPPVQIYFSAEAPTATNEPPPDLYAGFTQNEQIPFVIIHPSGESLGIIGDRSLSNIEGVVWAGTNGNLSMVINLLRWQWKTQKRRGRVRCYSVFKLYQRNGGCYSRA